MLSIKSILILFALTLSSQAKADFLSCDLQLDVLPNTDSSEEKQMFFEVEIPESGRSQMDGTMNTTSCFGTTFQSFSSESVRVFRYLDDGATKGGVSVAKLKIGNKYFKFNLKFAQQNSGLIASGKIIPFDDEFFIHQIAGGVCHFTNQRTGIFGFLDRAGDFMVNFRNNKGRIVCH